LFLLSGAGRCPRLRPNLLLSKNPVKTKYCKIPNCRKYVFFLFDGSTAGAVLGVICRIWLLPEEGTVWELALVIALYKCEPKSSLGFEAR
jgi:hypothetical protein